MLTTSKARRIVASLALLGALVVGQGGLASTADATGEPPATDAAATNAVAPTPTAARPGKPASVAAVGDSITQSTGTGALARETPKNSWATGWEVNSVAARIGVATNKRYNLSANGDKMSDFAPQILNGKSGGSGDVAALPADAGLVLVEFGGNDLCRDTVADMTPVETYRTQLKAGLAAVATRAPNALIHVMSVPDIYNLWYIRGAPQNSTYHPESQSSQASGINGARFYWDGLTPLGVKFPCQSLLTDPDSYDASDRDRRAQVRARNKLYNTVLATECGKVLRCRFDGNRLFDLTSNRVSPPDGALLPQAQWAFTDLDISRNTASFCPIPGLVGGGCGDHFHPSKQGQGKIADSATLSGRNWADTTMPTAGAAVLPSGRPGGVHRLSATVRFSGSDAAGLRGQEVRVHDPDGTTSAWTPSLGVAPDKVITKVGTSYVEVRSLDVNGNLSASVVTGVVVSPAAAPSGPVSPVVTAATTGLTLSWSAPADDGGSTITRYDITPLIGVPTPTSGPTFSTVARTASLPAVDAGTIARYQIVAVNAVGSSSPVFSGHALPPFASVTDFVSQQYEDFGATLVPGSTAPDVAGLTAGTETPSAFVERLRSSAWFDGAYGPATRLYKAYFMRLPDPSGLDYWARSRRNGRTLASISQQFSRSSEFQRRYGQLTNSVFIDTIYANVFDRAPDPEGRDFYLRRLNDGRWSRGQVVLQFSESSEYERKMRGTVAIVELVRGMTGRAPNQATVDGLLVVYDNDGTYGVFGRLIEAASYAERVLA